MEQFSRTVRLIGEGAFKKLSQSKIAVFGVGGVGSNAAMALCRAGIGNFFLADMDVVDVTNINRQSVARIDTVGKDKVAVMKEDMLKINPDVNAKTCKAFLTRDNLEEFLPESYDYVLDCIDNLTCKVFLAKLCYNKNIPLVSCMGAGNRINAHFQVVDIFDTFNDPVAKVMRKGLKEQGVPALKTVWTSDLPLKSKDGQRTPASVSFAPALAGITMAQFVFNELIKNEMEEI